jgi:broad specificity phosphatase PhoE
VAVTGNVRVSLLLARHGETLDNAAGLILGRRDPPLTEAGRNEARELAGAVRGDGIAAIWCSPLGRAKETAAIVGVALGLTPTVLDGLIESDRGEWEGRSVAELARVSPELHAAFEAADPAFTFPGGESLASQLKRTRAALDVVAAGPVPALVVAHAGTIRAALRALGDAPPPERLLPHGQAITVTWPAPATVAGRCVEVSARRAPADPPPPAPAHDSDRGRGR